MIPIVLFAYARPDHLRLTLNCLRQNQVPLVFVFSDGPSDISKENAVYEVRKILQSIDWCEIKIYERETNQGLGRSILNGVSEVLEKHGSAIIFEDDLICVPGTYKYICAALEHYHDDPRVMSVTGWNHPLVTPSDINNQPYFDGRAECWVWGTWNRAWQGMEKDSMSLMLQCKDQGIDIYCYGADLPEMAKLELKKNIWAVRFLYWHILNKGLCLRPPWSMVEHIGFDSEATNASDGSKWSNPPLNICPPIPQKWPEPKEHIDCSRLWQKAYGSRPTFVKKLYRFTRHIKQRILRGIS